MISQSRYVSKRKKAREAARIHRVARLLSATKFVNRRPRREGVAGVLVLQDRLTVCLRGKFCAA